MKTLEIKSLPDEWVDRDQMVLHACFQLLEDFVEQELSNPRCCRRHEGPELEELYAWWQRRKAQDDADWISGEQYREDSAKLIELMKLRYLLWT